MRAIVALGPHVAAKPLVNRQPKEAEPSGTNLMQRLQNQFEDLPSKVRQAKPAAVRAGSGSSTDPFRGRRINLSA